MEETQEALAARGHRPIVELLSLAAPTVAQMASYTLMQFIDTWMLARLGPAAPTAASNSGMMAFSFIGLGMGSLWLVNTLVSQSFGRGDEKQCGRYLWQGIWFAFAYSLLCLPAVLLARPMFAGFGHPPAEAAMEATYYRITLAGAGTKLLATALGQFMLAIDRPNVVLVAAVTAVAGNAVIAWAMIFGHLGLPAMGVAGSAWATNLGSGVELLVLAAFVLRPAVARRFNVFDFALRRTQFLTLLRVGLPSGFQWVLDILAWSLFANLVIGQIGPEAMAANTFMLRYMVLSFMPAIGLSTAVTALVGRSIGAGRPDLAVKVTHLGFKVTFVYQITCGAIFFLGRHALLKLFTDDPAILAIGATYLTYSAVYQLFDSLYINYNGALRGAGDTFVPATITGVLNWGFNVTGGYLAARYAKSWLGPGGPWLVATAYGAILGAIMLARFRRGRWKAIKLEARAAPAGEIPASNVEIRSATMA